MENIILEIATFLQFEPPYQFLTNIFLTLNFMIFDRVRLVECEKHKNRKKIWKKIATFPFKGCKAFRNYIKIAYLTIKMTELPKDPSE